MYGERSLSRGACGRNALDYRSLNLTSLNLSGNGEGCGGREAGKRLGGAWGCVLNGTGAKKKKKSLRVQVESPIYLLLFTTKDLGNGRL